MFAGSPSVYDRVLRNVYGRLNGREENISNVLGAFEESFRDQLKLKIEGELLSPYGLSREMFFARGRENFGDEEFTRILYQLNSVRLDTNFIVAGFDPEGELTLNLGDDRGQAAAA